MKKKDFKKLVKKTIAEAEKILRPPIVDPKAPSGYVRREVFNAEMRKRIDEVGAALDSMLDELAGDDEVARRRFKKHRLQRRR